MRAARLLSDRPVVLAGIAGLTAFAWFDLWRRGGGMAHGPSTDMTMAVPRALSSGLPHLLTAGAMWSIMMVAMMLPSATPMLLFFSVRRAQQAPGGAGFPGGLFAAGFLLVWLSWAWLAAGLRWALGAAPGGRRPARPRGGVPVHAAQARVPLPVPVAARLPAIAVAGGHLGCCAHGHPLRRLLRGMLLGAHGGALRGRGDEPAVGRRPGCLRPRGEDGAARTLARPRHGRGIDRMGSLPPGSACHVGSGADRAGRREGHFLGVFEILLRIPQSRMACRSTRRRTRALIPWWLCASTLRSHELLQAQPGPHGPAGLRPGSTSTIRSTSLCSAASVRATGRAPSQGGHHECRAREGLLPGSSLAAPRTSPPVPVARRRRSRQGTRRGFIGSGPLASCGSRHSVVG